MNYNTGGRQKSTAALQLHAYACAGSQTGRGTYIHTNDIRNSLLFIVHVHVCTKVNLRDRINGGRKGEGDGGEGIRREKKRNGGKRGREGEREERKGGHRGTEGVRSSLNINTHTCMESTMLHTYL